MTTASSEGAGLNLHPQWWYLYGEAYDFSDFVSHHPGGQQAISLGRGRECTALFESYHAFLPSQSLLNKFKVDPKDSQKDYPHKIQFNPYTFDDCGFYRTVKSRARDYFREQGLSSFRGDWMDILLWIVNVALFGVFGYQAFFRGSMIYASLAGVCKSLLVVRSTHAASHFSFSQWPRLNRFVYWMNMSLVGDTPAQWTAKHVIAHHIDTNVIPVDDDTMYPIKRVLPELPHLWFHQYQHCYIWLLYLFVFVPWTLSHSLKLIFGYMSGAVFEGTVAVRMDNPLDHIETLSSSLLGWVNNLLPLFTLPSHSSWCEVISVIGCYQIVSSAWFSLQFAVNHETPASIEGSGSGCRLWKQHRDWGEHQMRTSHNYSPNSPLALHLSGGLNYQIEHHLFPAVHYKFYPDLSKIVRETALEFNVPYLESQTFFDAVYNHTRLLRKMGAKPK